MPDLANIQARASAGDAASQFSLGNVCHLGLLGQPVDLEKAQHWYEKAAAQGHADALLNLGLLHFQDFPKAGGRRDAARALHFFEQAAGHGDAYAMYLAGEVCYHGEGNTRNLEKALAWFVQAARAGQGDALNTLGLMALKGDEVPRNLAKAADCFRRGAEAGHAPCQYNLACCHLEGEGVPRDAASAMRWMNAAAEQGHATAQYNLGAMLCQGAAGAPDKAAGLAWFEKAAALNEPEALYQLGQHYRQGDGVSPDELTAMHCYRRAADLDHLQAAFSLALMIEQGFLHQPGDPALAAQWYTRAAFKGHAPACHNLGILHARGLGVAHEADTARALFEYAIGCGEDSAMFSLGLLLYRGGPGLAPDPLEACVWALLSRQYRPEDGGQKLLDALAPHLGSEEIALAQEKAQAWQRQSTPLTWMSQG